jgi:hypothetical protein
VRVGFAGCIVPADRCQRTGAPTRLDLDHVFVPSFTFGLKVVLPLSIAAMWRSCSRSGTLTFWIVFEIRRSTEISTGLGSTLSHLWIPMAGTSPPST